MTPPYGPSGELQRALLWQCQQVFSGTHHTHWFDGLLTKLGDLEAARASRSVFGASTVARHAGHVLFCLKVMNDDPERPPEGVDWRLSWEDVNLDDESWPDLLRLLTDEAERLGRLTATLQIEPLSTARLLLIVNQLTHAAYHVGAIAQILKYEEFLAQEIAGAVQKGKTLVPGQG